MTINPYDQVINLPSADAYTVLRLLKSGMEDELSSWEDMAARKREKGMTKESRAANQIAKERKSALDEISAELDRVSKCTPPRKPNRFEGLLSLQDAAEKAGIDASTLRKAISSGRIQEGHGAVKFGKQWVITEDALKCFMQ